MKSESNLLAKPQLTDSEDEDEKSPFEMPKKAATVPRKQSVHDQKIKTFFNIRKLKEDEERKKL